MLRSLSTKVAGDAERGEKLRSVKKQSAYDECHAAIFMAWPTSFDMNNSMLRCLRSPNDLPRHRNGNSYAEDGNRARA